ncbi:MAG: hypothetical protein HY720_14620 [Planctomycetes bacterium]|nr:hypothetical protein [Planctomycetota bacterium]
MVDPGDVIRIVTDAVRLVRHGEIVVFGSAALAFWLRNAPASRDVDLVCEPRECADPIQALMGELSWYHKRHGAYVEVCEPETFTPPSGWRERAREIQVEERVDVRLIVPHPHDLLLSKLDRWESKDREHAVRVLGEFPMTVAELEERTARMPHRTGVVTEPDRIARFEAALEDLRRMLVSP